MKRMKRMKTIEIQLIKTMVIPLDKIRTYNPALRTLYEYAPKDVYGYYTIGKDFLLMQLETDPLTIGLVPMLKDFYKEYGDMKYSQQYQAVLQEFEQYDSITFEMCESIGYEHYDTFDPVFSNDASPKPFLMYENGVKADCTGITLHTIPPEKATFSMLYTLEKEIQEKLSAHPLAKTLKVCIR